MSAEVSSKSSGPPLRQLLKAYWRCWLGDLRGARTLAEAMIARDNSDKVAQRLLTKIKEKQVDTGTFEQWEPTPLGQKVLHGSVTLLALFATVKLAGFGFQKGFTYLIYLPGKNGASTYLSLWFVLLIFLTWSVASIYLLARMLSNRKW